MFNRRTFLGFSLAGILGSLGLKFQAQTPQTGITDLMAELEPGQMMGFYFHNSPKLRRKIESYLGPTTFSLNSYLDKNKDSFPSDFIILDSYKVPPEFWKKLDESLKKPSLKLWEYKHLRMKYLADLTRRFSLRTYYLDDVRQKVNAWGYESLLSMSSPSCYYVSLGLVSVDNSRLIITKDRYSNRNGQIVQG